MFLLACTGASVDSGEGLVVDAPDDVALNDEDGGLQVDVVGGSAPGWFFGPAWPDLEFVNEACLDADDVCHTLGATGGFIDIQICDEPVDGVTCIPVEHYRVGRMSFVLKPSLGSGCWVWGQEATYWEELGCSETAWSPESY